MLVKPLISLVSFSESSICISYACLLQHFMWLLVNPLKFVWFLTIVYLCNICVLSVALHVTKWLWKENDMLYPSLILFFPLHGMIFLLQRLIASRCTVTWFQMWSWHIVWLVQCSRPCSDKAATSRLTKEWPSKLFMIWGHFTMPFQELSKPKKNHEFFKKYQNISKIYENLWKGA